MSIVHINEIVPAGNQFEFILRWLNKAKAQLTIEEVAIAIGMMRIIGLGSCRSFKNGQFTILEAEAS